jgi:hypothetical protein
MQEVTNATYKKTTAEGRTIRSSLGGESRSVVHEMFGKDNILIRRYTQYKYARPLIIFQQHIIDEGKL